MTEFIPSDTIDEAASTVRQRTAYRPAIGLVLGSGLSGLAEAVEDPDIIPCDELPHWPVSTAPGHDGRLVLGQLQNKTVLVLQGRVHHYEGYTMAQITMPVRVMRRLGINTIILTNAAGGLNPDFQAGDLMLIRDHINLPGLAGRNPLRGPNDDEAGPRFPDMTEPYDPDLRQVAREVAEAGNSSLREGVYAFVGGPSYETPAELRLLRTVGADAVGMSTVPSVVVARHSGMRVLGISTITNMATPDPLPGQKTTHEEVLEVGNLVVPRLTSLIHGILNRL
ncbi:MAG TPA: purine-nucleoside phosphorylase [Candidatus Sulfomarinibacteraceae bacterium]|nr:purine-nucleoside phosphorylase [Candidatus Sulfomarinibacteraceae bacterium]